MSQFDINLGNRIRELRQHTGQTQQALAEHLGLTHRDSVSKFELGRQAISVEHLVQIAFFLGVKVEDLLTGEMDNLVQIAEMRGRLLTAMFHMEHAIEALKGEDAEED